MRYTVCEKEMPVETNDKRIFGKAFVPENVSGKLKAVILSHGYNSSFEHVSDVAFALAEKGVFAYCYDFCGGSIISKSSGKSVDMSINSEISDLKDVFEFIKSLEIVDENNIYLYGESQGGFVSALAAAELGEAVKGIYLLYPAFCIPDDWKKRMDEELPETFDVMGMTLSKKFCLGLPEYDVFEFVKKYKGKAAIFHGDSDSLVSLEYSEKAAQSFENSTLQIFRNEGHGFSKEARAELVKQICSDF